MCVFQMISDCAWLCRQSWTTCGSSRLAASTFSRWRADW